MGHGEEKNARRSVPQFGGWDQNGPDPTNYTVVFTQARANRKQNKTDLTEFKRNSLGNEQEFLAAHSQHGHHQQDDSVMQKLVALMFGMGGHRFGFLQH
ncbi:PREDICTED: RPM1-interacting 4 (RIN4) family [Prunus dulcis]|uniref:PREDICTED: RPM1-interacting 4 (RIN4) family n=1 Tax=Prunus dulcis TaxID=3755 RepID=A0A5E4FMF4_PRUDU|nr:uncharacterized protein LOC117625875 isoform X1 [Prunus dulcis]KAI5335021.1 hypothetical protein L3X38_025154 [Prunus dulcis]VVA27158.1 PREDICTED: RPM1-interacting 4 (RIN4) family [Prunus dulcis]